MPPRGHKKPETNDPQNNGLPGVSSLEAEQEVPDVIGALLLLLLLLLFLLFPS